jgi:hypothetical protein
LIFFFVSSLLFLLVFPVRIAPGGFFGHMIGIGGTVLMALTLMYPFRKRVLKIKGRKNPISSHIYYGLIGPTLVVWHSGHTLISHIGSLAFLLMLIIVLSGIGGRFLFKNINLSLKENERDLALLNRTFRENRGKIEIHCRVYLGVDQTRPAPSTVDEPIPPHMASQCMQVYHLAQLIAEKEQAVSAFSATKTLFSRWLRLHIYLTISLFAVVFVHILTTVYYGLRWIR